METLPLHPKLVHLPIALAVLMPLITTGMLLAWWRDILPRRAWWGVVGLQAILLASGLAARATGEDDEERVERVVPEAAIEAHDEAAGAFVVGAGVALVLVLGAALTRPAGLAKGVAAAATVATVVVLWLGYRVGEAGGRLVYQHNAGAAYTSAAGGAAGGAGGAAAPPAAPRRDDD